ncbi:hypothetical protein [Vibrio sp. CUB2]|uniref:hypothetical protein n=1 Tax=Vibrio sp. CUB2 TaxID=2315233 RepID=UPI00076A6AA2|nr:hypothetical protein [Vibrio sp. CUB2]
MRNKELILHIGMHKTGSSSLQLYLRDTKDGDFEFLSWDKYGNSSNIVDCSGHTYKVYEKRLRKLLITATSKKVVLSAEHLFFIEDTDVLKNLNNILLEFFQRIKVYVYLRRQDKAALSFKQQAAKGRVKNQMPSSYLMGHENGALPNIDEKIYRYFDYHSKLVKWVDVFGKDNVFVRVFDKDALFESDVVSDFYSWAGLNGYATRKNVNESLCRNFSLISHKLLDMNYPAEVIDFVRQKIHPDDVSIKPYLTTAKSFFAAFSQSNYQLTQSGIIPFFNGFEFDDNEYSDEANDKLTESEYDFIIESVGEFYKAL